VLRRGFLVERRRGTEEVSVEISPFSRTPGETSSVPFVLEEPNRAYAALIADPEVWGPEQAERAIWDNTLTDGLDDDGLMEL
jgi:hypothetical protein